MASREDLKDIDEESELLLIAAIVYLFCSQDGSFPPLDMAGVARDFALATGYRISEVKELLPFLSQDKCTYPQAYTIRNGYAVGLLIDRVLPARGRRSFEYDFDMLAKTSSDISARWLPHAFVDGLGIEYGGLVDIEARSALEKLTALISEKAVSAGLISAEEESADEAHDADKRSSLGADVDMALASLEISDEPVCFLEAVTQSNYERLSQFYYDYDPADEQVIEAAPLPVEHIELPFPLNAADADGGALAPSCGVRREQGISTVSARQDAEDSPESNAGEEDHAEPVATDAHAMPFVPSAESQRTRNAISAAMEARKKRRKRSAAIDYDVLGDLLDDDADDGGDAEPARQTYLNVDRGKLREVKRNARTRQREHTSSDLPENDVVRMLAPERYDRMLDLSALRADDMDLLMSAGKYSRLTEELMNEAMSSFCEMIAGLTILDVAEMLGIREEPYLAISVGDTIDLTYVPAAYMPSVRKRTFDISTSVSRLATRSSGSRRKIEIHISHAKELKMLIAMELSMPGIGEPSVLEITEVASFVAPDDMALFDKPTGGADV
jgi:hypothetical protein